MWKEGCECQKRAINVKRGLNRDLLSRSHSSSRVVQKGPMNMKRDLWMWKETYECEKRPSHASRAVAHVYVKRGLWMWKETYVCQKRAMNVKRDLCMSKEGYECEKRPMYVKKEGYECEMRAQGSTETYWHSRAQETNFHIHRFLLTFIGLFSHS